MIFLRYESLKEYIKRFPITSSIILVQILLYILMELTGDATTFETLKRFGAMFGGRPGEAPEYWRYFAAIFLHIGFAHLLFNCFAMYVFAPPLELIMRRWHFLLFYLGSGFCGNALAQVMNSEPYFGAGASGAIYGIYGAYLYLALFRKDVMDKQSGSTVKIILVMGLIHSIVSPQVSLYGHLGGFLGGLLLFVALIRFVYTRR